MTASLQPVAGHDRILRLRFDSAVLGRTTESLVWVPPNAAGRALPVVYYLHGTVATVLPRPLRAVLERRARRGRPVPPLLLAPRDAVVHPYTMRFDETLDRHEFLLVAPDAGAPPWCMACNWVDGVRGHGVLAESYLRDELFGVVEERFATRTDRAGRAIIGHSMGGGGAMIQAFRHPDRFAFVGCSSGTLSLMNDRTSRSGVRWLFYNRTQGFRPIPMERDRYRAVNLLDLAGNVAGTDLEIVVAAGDGASTGERRPGPPPPDPDAQARMDRRMERNVRRNNDRLVPKLRARGVRLDYVTRAGDHALGASTFRELFLERLNARWRQDR